MAEANDKSSAEDMREMNKLIDEEVAKKRELLSKVLDRCCLYYKHKYENILSEALQQKPACEINFKADVANKVAPIAEKKIEAQLRNAMRLESEFREVLSSGGVHDAIGDDGNESFRRYDQNDHNQRKFPRNHFDSDRNSPNQRFSPRNHYGQVHQRSSTNPRISPSNYGSEQNKYNPRNNSSNQGSGQNYPNPRNNHSNQGSGPNYANPRNNHSNQSSEQNYPNPRNNHSNQGSEQNNPNPKNFPNKRGSYSNNAGARNSSINQNYFDDNSPSTKNTMTNQNSSKGGAIPKHRPPNPFSTSFNSKNYSEQPKLTNETYTEAETPLRNRPNLPMFMSNIDPLSVSPKQGDVLGAQLGIDSKSASDLTACRDYLVVARNKKLDFFKLESIDAGTANPSDKLEKELSFDLSKEPQVVKCLSDKCIVFGAWEDELQFMFQIIAVDFDLDPDVATERTVLTVPGIACIATQCLPCNNSLSQYQETMFIVQADGSLHCFDQQFNYTNSNQTITCFSYNVYDTDAFYDSFSGVSLIAACFDHLNLLEIVERDSKSNSANLLQHLTVKNPRRVKMVSLDTILVGCFELNFQGFVHLIQRNHQGFNSSKFSTTKSVNSFSCCPSLDNIWGLTFVEKNRNVYMLHRKQNDTSNLIVVSLAHLT